MLRIKKTYAVLIFGAACVLGFFVLFSVGGSVRLVAIKSGSMAPQWAVGTLLVLTPESARQVTVGQEILYHPPARIFNGLVVHKVIDKSTISLPHRRGGVSHQINIRTKGDANPGPDAWIDSLSNNVPVWHVSDVIPYLGMISLEITNWRFDLLFVALGVVGLLWVVTSEVIAARKARMGEPVGST